MEMTYTKSQFEMPDGKYLARFTGVTLREASGKIGQDGKPMGPAMTWDFEIVEPGSEHAGKKADRLTSRMPTPKSACGKFLAAVSDSVLKDGQSVDLQQFVGAIYRVTVIENRISDAPAPVRVYDHPLANGQKATPNIGTQAAPATSPPAAPPRSGPPPRSAPAVAKYWVALNPDADPELTTEAALKEIVTGDQGKALNWEAIQVCKDGDQTWKRFTEAFPDAKNWTPF